MIFKYSQSSNSGGYFEGKKELIHAQKVFEVEKERNEEKGGRGCSRGSITCFIIRNINHMWHCMNFTQIINKKKWHLKSRPGRVESLFSLKNIFLYSGFRIPGLCMNFSFYFVKCTKSNDKVMRTMNV